MTEFKWQVDRWLLSAEWVQVSTALENKVRNCKKTRCKDIQELPCSQECEKPWKDLQEYVKEKTQLYARKGAGYCKEECWETKEIEKCVEKCVGEYELLFDDLRKNLIDRAASTRVFS